MRRAALLVCGLAALAAPGRAQAYGWPIEPFDVQHPVRADFNDPRVDGHGHSFHFGIDIPAPDGTPVYAVTGGTAFLRSDAVVVVEPGGSRTFGYWHVVPAVNGFQLVEPLELIGYVAKGWGHVHFAESEHGRYLNPLRPEGIEPYDDWTSPTIAGIGFRRGGRRLPTSALGGRVDVVVDAYDTPPLLPPGPWLGTLLPPAELRWRLLRGHQEVKPWRTAVELGSDLLSARRFGAVYAPGTRQNRANRPGRYRFYLLRHWDVTALEPGDYRLEVEASDIRGNRALAALPFHASA
jgi:hypothetical protein